MELQKSSVQFGDEFNPQNEHWSAASVAVRRNDFFRLHSRARVQLEFQMPERKKGSEMRWDLSARDAKRLAVQILGLLSSTETQKLGLQLVDRLIDVESPDSRTREAIHPTVRAPILTVPKASFSPQQSSRPAGNRRARGVGQRNV